MMRLTVTVLRRTPGMRRERYARLPLAGVVATILLMLTGCSPLQLPFSSHTTSHTSVGTGPTSAVIAAENAKPGTTAWTIRQPSLQNAQVEAYASATSVQAGDTLRFFVSTRVDKTRYAIDIYRLGWYQGLGGRLMYHADETGTAQGYYVTGAPSVSACPTCRLNTQTRLLEANWAPSVSVKIPASWVTGVYEAAFTTSSGSDYYLTFDVRSGAPTAFIVVTDDTTVAAYNHWGGYSLYTGPDGTYATRAYKVSFDRPVDYADMHGLPFEIDAIRWLEDNHYDVSYMSSVDLHEHPEWLLNHRAYISLGHDEYWSWQMRQGVQTALTSGVSLIFMGADAGDWQIRFEPSSSGAPDRVVVCYKEGYLDPLWKKDNARVTVKWRVAPVSLPEDGLRGIMQASYSLRPPGFPWYLDPEGALSPLVAGTGLKPDTAYGCEIVGYEWDQVMADSTTPRNLVVLGTSPTVDYQGHKGVANTTYYRSTSGALVFSSGSIQWSYALDTVRLYTSGLVDCGYKPTLVPGIQALMTNVLNAALHH